MPEKSVKVRVVRQFLANIGPAGESKIIPITPKGKTDELPESVVEAVKEAKPPVVELVK